MGGKTPWGHQEGALIALLSDSHLLLATPTGSGKSLVAYGFMFQALCQGRKVYYTAPIKALVNEKFFEGLSIFGKGFVGMLTGDTSIDPAAPIIFCTAEILANQSLRAQAGGECCVIMDEAHYYGDSQRGWAWQVPLLDMPEAQFLLMSATLGDPSSIISTLRRTTSRKVEYISDAPRPVPLEYEYEAEPIQQIALELVSKSLDPAYIVHTSQEAALKDAESLANFGIVSKERREKVKEAIKGFKFTTSFGKTLKRLLSAGIGVHHAGMLPRYRRLIEQLAQSGKLPLICGTDTLGVGINVPIHTVVFTSLAKWDGVKDRRLKVREFRQIAGRAGRSGFDKEGLVVCQAPPEEIEAKEGKEKGGKRKRKPAPTQGPSWDKSTFEKLVSSPSETLIPHLKVSHSMVLAEVVQGGKAKDRLAGLIESSAQTELQKSRLLLQSDEIFSALIESGVIVLSNDGSYSTTIDVPDNFALNEPLSPFLFSALPLLNRDSPTYELDLISVVESILEDPDAILRAQEKRARDEAIGEMKAEGVEWEERMERLQEVTYPKPLEKGLEESFEDYKKEMPWARDYVLSPKSILRDMIETCSNFNEYVSRYSISRVEGILLRYLSDAWKVLVHTIPYECYTPHLAEIASWLGLLIDAVDSSLLDEWAKEGSMAAGGEESEREDPEDWMTQRKGLVLMARNALFRRVELIASDKFEELGDMDSRWGMGVRAWDEALEEFYSQHEAVDISQDARSGKYFLIEPTASLEGFWHCRQIIKDSEGDMDWSICADLDCASSLAEGQAVFKDYSFAPFEALGN
ncbi:MAG: DUF3516 domain-containing protein [Aeriscardovia sp.]|nr:DUF3516 domain-containing protein [Aeriscardovia sp.]